MAGLKSGRAVVATPGTAVPLSAASVAVTSVTVTAETDNTGLVVVGGPDVVAALATRKGTPLAAGQAMSFTDADLDELGDVWVDAVVASDGVTFTFGVLS